MHGKVGLLMTEPVARSSECRRVGRYLICGEMASGGMASVHLGRLLGPAGFSKIVAIKRLHSQFARDPEFLSMFIDEARLASVISHPNVVSSLDVVVEDSELSLVMEYVHGETLAQLIRLARKQHAAVPLGIVQRILCDALDGLHAAHTASAAGRALNIVHRDVSPQNIMVSDNGVARVLDFGIAKAESQRQNTLPGRVKGKFSYLSPEQVRGLPLDARTDIFSAGVVLWESLTGQRLFSLQGAAKTVERVLNAPIPAPSSKNPAISPALDRVVLKALERTASRRFQSAAEFADALRAVRGEATRAELSAWVCRTAEKVLARRSQALRELATIDSTAATAGAHPVWEPAPVWEEKTVLEPPKDERSSLESLWEARSASITSGGTTRSITPQVQGPRWRRRIAGLGLTLVVSLLSVAGFVASRRPAHPPIGSSPRAASSMPEPSGARAPSVREAANTATSQAKSALVSASSVAAPATAAVPIVQLDQLPEAPRATRLKSATPVSAKTARSERKPAPAIDCDPPYRIDAAGVRRVRLECL